MNRPSNDFDTPLSAAASRGHVAAVLALLEGGASVKPYLGAATERLDCGEPGGIGGRAQVGRFIGPLTSFALAQKPCGGS